MTAVGYVRVSTEDQAKEGISLDYQKSKIRAYCESLIFLIGEGSRHCMPLEVSWRFRF
jgi:DNA invertase Pin-like site-specific DNA recombinase